MSLKINADKSKVTVIRKDHRANIKKVNVNGEAMEEDIKYKYLRVTMGTNGGIEEEVAHKSRME